MLRKALAVCVALWAVSGVAVAGDMDAGGRKLAAVDEDWSKAAVARDVDKVASFYAEEALVYPPNAPIVAGRAAAQKVWAAMFTDPSFTISWKTAHASIAKSGDLGYTAGTYEDSFKGADGNTVHEAGKYVCVWAKQRDGSWKAIHDTWNSDTK